MSLFLYAVTPSYSAAGLLAYALNKYCDHTVAWFKSKGVEGFDKYYEKAVFGQNQKLDSEILLIESI